MTEKSSPTLFYPTERTALFIDGRGLFYASKALGFDIDFTAFRTLFAKRSHLVRATYYTTTLELSDDDNDSYDPTRPIVDWLSYNGYTTSTRQWKAPSNSDDNTRRRPSMNIDIAVDALTQTADIAHVVLVSGDSDLCPLVRALKHIGKRVTLVSTIRTSPAQASDELRRLADNFVDLAEIKRDIERKERIKKAEV